MQRFTPPGHRESTIKIISDEKGWTHGGEKGAHNYIDNLGSKKAGPFIESWETQLEHGLCGGGAARQPSNGHRLQNAELGPRHDDAR
jgi:hypothetical protein